MAVIDKLAWICVLDGRLLVARSRGREAFYLPGGKREEGESDAEALTREVREEVGPQLDAGSLRHVLTHEAPAHGKPGLTVRMTCYEAAHRGALAPHSEIEELAWVTLAEADSLSDGARGVLEQLAGRGLVRSRAPRPRAVLFDLDDTLVDTREVKWEHARQVTRQFYGFELTDAELEASWGKPFDVMITELYRNSASLEQMRADNEALEPHYPKAEIPGAIETVRRLAGAGLLLGVVTSTNTARARAQMRTIGFPLGSFEIIQGADRTQRHKPDPRVFEPALERLAESGIGPASTVYVGDSAADRAAAIGAGMDLIAIASSLPRDAAPKGHRPAVLGSVAELPGHLLG